MAHELRASISWASDCDVRRGRRARMARMEIAARRKVRRGRFLRMRDSTGFERKPPIGLASCSFVDVTGQQQ